MSYVMNLHLGVMQTQGHRNPNFPTTPLMGGMYMGYKSLLHLLQESRENTVQRWTASFFMSLFLSAVPIWSSA